MKKLKCLLGAFLLLVIISACTKVEEKKPLKIALIIWGPNSPIYVAREKGFLKEESVEVEIVLCPSNGDMVEKYRNNEIDGAFLVFLDLFSLWEEGIPSKFVLITDYTNGADVLMARPEFKKVKDLKGKKIGIDGVNSFSHLFVLKLAEKHGLREMDIQLENVAVLDVPRLMEQGIIDAGHVYEPAISEAKSKGYKILADSSETPGLIFDGLVFHEKILKERSEDIQKVINAWFKAKEFIKDNRQEGMGIMAKAHNLQVKEFEKYFEGLKDFGLEDNIESFKKSDDVESLYKSAEIVREFLLKRGQLSEVPGFDEIIETKFVNKVSSFKEAKR